MTPDLYELGRVHKDRAAARSGEIPANAEIVDRLDGGYEQAAARSCTLKGCAEPVTAYLL